MFRVQSGNVKGALVPVSVITVFFNSDKNVQHTDCHQGDCHNQKEGAVLSLACKSIPKQSESDGSDNGDQCSQQLLKQCLVAFRAVSSVRVVSV